MKNCIVLTSILALAACGGSGGGKPSDITPSGGYVDRVGQSNAQITGMVSNSKYQVTKYVANKLGTDAESVNLSRAAFTPSAPTGQIDYDTARELVDLAEWLANDTTTEDDIVSMFNNSKQDKNKIKAALKLLDNMYCFVGGSAQETATRILSRRSDFAEPLANLKQKTEVFNLKDVTFDILENVDLITKLKFNVNTETGRVESIEYTEAEDLINEGYDMIAGPYRRQDDTNFFNAEMVAEGPDFAGTEYEGQTFNIPHEYISYGKDLGLRYSDFGVLRVHFNRIPIPELAVWGTQDVPFAGGYTTKRIYTEDSNGNPEYDRMTELAASGNIEFTGKAVGDVTIEDWSAGIGGASIPLPGGTLVDDQATLVFANDGTQTITADFSDRWYKIQAIHKNSDNTSKLLFVDCSGGDCRGAGTGGDDERFHLDRYRTGVVTDWLPNGESVHNGDMDETIVFKTGFYGDNDIPSEATGLAHYQIQSGDEINVGTLEDPDYEKENIMNLDLGFGGTRN